MLKDSYDREKEIIRPLQKNIKARKRSYLVLECLELFTTLVAMKTRDSVRFLEFYLSRASFKTYLKNK